MSGRKGKVQLNYGLPVEPLGPKVRAGKGFTSSAPSSSAFTFDPYVSPKEELTLQHRPGVLNMSSTLDQAEQSLNTLANEKAKEKPFMDMNYQEAMKDLSVKQALGLGVASEGFKVAGALHDIRANEEAQMAQMRDEFDLAFGSQEFDAQRLELQQNRNMMKEVLAALDNIDAQAAALPAQTLRSQQQTFIRNPL